MTPQDWLGVISTLAVLTAVIGLAALAIYQLLKNKRP